MRSRPLISRRYWVNGRASQRPSLFLPGRRGQIAIWNPFDNPDGNYNVAIAATSGSGKSALTQEYIVALLGAGGRVWVIDVGRSYEKTCKLLGGEFIEFKSDHPISLNLFTYIDQMDDESLEILKPLLAAMARPQSNVTDEEMTFLEKGVKAAWDQKGQKCQHHHGGGLAQPTSQSDLHDAFAFALSLHQTRHVRQIF